MKISKKRIIVCGVLLLLLFICARSLICGADVENQKVIFSCDQVSGNSARSLEELFRPVQADQAGERAGTSLSDIEIGYGNHRLTFRGDLKYDGNAVSIRSQGPIYKNEKTENAGIFGNLVFAEMEDVEDWHFVQFRIDKDHENICIILQNTISRELVQFLIGISSDQFDRFYNLQDNTIHGTELEKKIVSLYSVSGNLLDAPERETASYGSSAIGYSGDDSQERTEQAEALLTLMLNAPNPQIESMYRRLLDEAAEGIPAADFGDSADSQEIYGLDAEGAREELADALGNYVTDGFIDSCLSMNELMSWQYFCISEDISSKTEELTVANTETKDQLRYDAVLQVTQNEVQQVIHVTGMIRFQDTGKIDYATLQGRDLKQIYSGKTTKNTENVLPRPEFPLEEAVITAALKQAGLSGEISESETTSYTEGHRLHVVRSLTETYADRTDLDGTDADRADLDNADSEEVQDSPGARVIVAGISSAVTEGERMLSIVFDQKDVPDLFAWEDWKKQIVFASLLFGGCEDGEEVYQMLLEGDLPKGKDGKDSFIWTTELPIGFCHMRYTSHMIDGEYGTPVLRSAATLVVTIYESEELYQKQQERITQARESLGVQDCFGSSALFCNGWLEETVGLPAFPLICGVE